MPSNARARAARLALAALTVAGLALGAVTPASASAGTGRFGAPFFVDPTQAAAQAAAAASGSARTRLQRIASGATANWFGSWNPDVRAAVASTVTRAAAADTVPVLVMYDIPKLYCSGGGAASASAYRAWVRAFVRGLGTTRAIVIVEPDALAQVTCVGSRGAQAERLGLLKYAVQRVAAQHSWAYLDAGHSDWWPAATIASRLRTAGVGQAAGFSLNVANYRPTAELIRYGTAVSKRVGGRHFVLDTGRNGAKVAAGEWCNARGAKLGARPTTRTASRLVDAYLWIKPPGVSDGTCNGGPSAGVWWQAGALTIAR